MKKLFNLLLSCIFAIGCNKIDAKKYNLEALCSWKPLMHCEDTAEQNNLGSSQPVSEVTPTPTPTPTSTPVVTTILDTAKAFMRASNYTNPSVFGPYTLNSVPGAAPSVNTDYLDFLYDGSYYGTKGLYAQGPNASLNGNAFTLFMTVTFDATTAGNYSYLFATDSSAPGPVFNIHMENADATSVMMVIENNDSVGNYYSHWVYVPVSIFDHKVVITIVADKMLDYSAANIRHFKTYFNGVEIDDAINSSWAQTTTAVAPFLDNQKIYIGYTPSSSAGAVGVSGKVYNFGIFDKALTPTEVTELFALVK